METTVDQPCRDRVTKLESEVLDLKSNYAPMLVIEQRFSATEKSINRIESAITRTNDTMVAMAKQFEVSSAETGRQLKVVFEMDSQRMQKIAEHQQELQNEKIAAIRTEAAERIALVQAERDKVLQENARLAEQGKLINRMKNWKFVMGFLVTLITVVSLLFGGLFWIVRYAINNQ